MILDLDLIQRLRKLFVDHDTKGFNLRDFVYAFGSPIQALMYSRLFWPEFVEIDDMVLLKEAVEDAEDLRRLKETFERYGKNRQKTEKSFNVTEIPDDIFGRLGYETTEEENHCLAQMLAEMWSCRLRILHPERKFKLEILEGDAANGDVEVIFY